MDTVALLGSTLGLGLVAGFRLYAAVLAVGLGIRLGLVTLHPGLAHLRVLANDYVLAAAAVAYFLEFLADKIPWVDSVWDSVHTLIRPLGAAFLGATAVGSLDPVTQWIVALLCGGVALTGHSTKAGARLVVNHSPEPFSNLAVSVFEDLLAVLGVWLSLAHPVFMLGVVLAFLAAFLWLSPKIFRLMKVEAIAFVALARKLLAGSCVSSALPARYADYLDRLGYRVELSVRSVAGKGVRGLRHSVGYLCFAGDQARFITRRLFRFRQHSIEMPNLQDTRYSRRLLVDRLVLRIGPRQETFYFFKDVPAELVLRHLTSVLTLGSSVAPSSHP
jgi:hypothetical protein